MNPSATKHRGRPRCFNEDEALHSAMRVFWRYGYEGASLAVLTKEMGINRPSLYAAFGDKEGLFLKAMEQYEKEMAEYTDAALKEPSARAAMERLLLGIVDLTTCPQNPHGCLLIQGGLATGHECEAVRNVMKRRRNAGERAVLRRLQHAQTEGDLPADADPGALAKYIAALMRGIAVQAADGATRQQLQAVVKTAMKAWPN